MILEMKVSEADQNGFRRCYEIGTTADVQIVTSDGQRIPAHSNILASASPVLESLVYRPRKYWNSERVIPILGAPSKAVVAFLHFLYSSSRSGLSSVEGEEAMEKYGVQLLVLSHAYRVGWLKRGCEAALARPLRADTVVDAIQIAKLCDASWLYQRCMRLLSKDFGSVQQSEAWRFIQMNDPRLELEILQFLQDADQRKKRWGREREDQEIYQQLSEAMECLLHICTEGCTDVGPYDREPPSKSKGPCTRFRTCEGLQLLIRHFANCSKKLSNGGACPHCKRMWQLFRLHSSTCDRFDACKVPLCKQFKLKVQMEGKGDDGTWRLLVKKVLAAKVMCSLANRKRPEQLQKPFTRSNRSIR